MNYFYCKLDLKHQSVHTCSMLDSHRVACDSTVTYRPSSTHFQVKLIKISVLVTNLVLRARLSHHAVKFTRNIFVPGIQVYNFDNSVCLHIYGYLYRLSKKMREGNVFSRVCPSVFSQGGGRVRCDHNLWCIGLHCTVDILLECCLVFCFGFKFFSRKGLFDVYRIWSRFSLNIYLICFFGFHIAKESLSAH